MELFSFYQSFMMTAQMLMSGQPGAGVNLRVIIVCAVFALIAWGTFFVLQGIGLSTMAKNRGMKKRWLAFVPFVNVLYLGKLAGDCEMFGHKMKHASVYAMVAQIVSTVLYLALMIAEGILYTVYAENITMGSTGVVWVGLTGFAGFLNVFYTYWGSLLCSVFALVYELLVFLLMMALLKKYAPSKYLFLSFLQLFVPLSRYIVIFVLRNKKQVDYDAYMRAQYEDFARRNATYGTPYGNPYNRYGNSRYNRPPYGQNPYGNPYANPYGNGQYGGEGKRDKGDDEPFAEFGSNDDDNPFEDFNGD